MAAVMPEDTVWLSASAGTGKTQVLSSRVLRLLLRPDVEPSQILCLTFTKAGATEMAARINDKLAGWARLGDPELAAELDAIGADIDEASLKHARTLFAAVLDCPGGGLRIDTIHAFSQWLLAAFPLESGLLPGTRPMEDRERVLLARRVLADLLVHAEADPLGDPQLSAAAADLSLRMGAEAVEAFLLRCASACEAWFGPGSWQEPMRPHVLRLVGLPGDADEDSLVRMCGDEEFDVRSLRRCLETNRGWKAATGQKAAEAIAAWLGNDPAGRRAGLDALQDVFLTKKGEPRSTTSLDKLDPDYPGYCSRVIGCLQTIAQRAALLALVDRLVPALRLGRAFALAWDEAKKREGLIDFDDQIHRAADLLGQRALSEWIRYKLDRRFDHILVDEAQDTNAAQWDIIFAMAEEFWAGQGQRSDRLRTLFVVGDYKQAIFRFQGTSPENFRRAADRVRAVMHGAHESASREPEGRRPRPLVELGLDRSFRTAQDVLDIVDRGLREIGHGSFGLDRPAERHVGQARPGYVALWQPIGAATDDDDAAVEAEEEGAETWLSRPDRQLAERIARQVRAWLDPQGPGFRLHKGDPRRAGPGDVMVLVRKRKELAGLIVARLHALGVPVAGVDRLRLGAPLAVKDLVAALRFAAQPLDDLNLANLLVSPLMGWSQEMLLEHGYRPPGERRALWAHLRASPDPLVRESVARLFTLLDRADFEPPHVLLQWLLSGPWQARARLVARLGTEANDPIDELVNAAIAFSATATPGIVGFLAWFDAGDGELKREADNAAGLVRVMTVHGSKGLQAPIVILADATGNPDESRERGLDMPDPLDDRRRIPLPPLRKEEKWGRIAEEAEKVKQAEMEEHWRLLYVAMTRAEEALFVGGALGPKDRGEAAPNSWYARLVGLFPPEAAVADAIWDSRREWGKVPEPLPPSGGPAELPLPEPLPPVLLRQPPAEPLPPRPLAPSALGEDIAADPPLPAGAALDAARRGTLMHKLLERLPEFAPAEREAAAQGWLARQASDFAKEDRDAIVASTVGIVSDPQWSELFGPDSLAEVPFSAVVGGQVIAGSVDRLLVAADRVRIVDFKTTRRPPATLEDVPEAVLRQMAAYAAALSQIYPGRPIDAAILYTAAPRLIPVPPALLEARKPALATPE